MKSTLEARLAQSKNIEFLPLNDQNYKHIYVTKHTPNKASARPKQVWNNVRRISS